MCIPNNYIERSFYHFSHTDNLDSIIGHGGLLSTNEKNRRQIGHHNIANMDIQNRRHRTSVPIGNGGGIHDYVPFYFASTNPMLLGLINRKVIDQSCIFFIIVSINRLLDQNVIFTDAAANADNPPHFYDDPADLYNLSWDLIDSRRWGEDSPEERALRMAEVLVYRNVPLEWIEGFVVFDQICADYISNRYRAHGLTSPPIYINWFNDRSFFFRKFFFPDRKNETLVTGPLELYQKFQSVVDEIINRRKIYCNPNAQFTDIADALEKIENNFCIIPELRGIYNLQTDNTVHSQTVSDHTIAVVDGLQAMKYYDNINDADRNILRLSAYLHDIGKGPKEKWENEIQQAYPDHPVDAIPMLARILSEEFTDITDDEIRKICLLVIYHDLMGDIIACGRDVNELIDLNCNTNELHLLAILSLADVHTLNVSWYINVNNKIEQLINGVIRN